jgi:hypothetical protein
MNYSKVDTPLICFSPNTAASSFSKIVTLFGKGFLLDKLTFTDQSNLPLVTVDGNIYNVSGAASCVQTGALNFICNQIQIRMKYSDTTLYKQLDLTVKNKINDQICSISSTNQLFTVSTPVLNSITPSSVCNVKSDVNFIIQGDHMIKYGNLEPFVTIDGKNYNASNVYGCTTQGLVQRCTFINVTVSQSALQTGNIQTPVIVTNPFPFSCSSDQITLVVSPTPSINSTVPSTLCAEIGKVKTLLIKGSGFISSSTVKLRKGVTEISALSQRIVGNDLEATFSSQLESGKYKVVVSNYVGCDSESTFEIDVFPIVLVFLVNPPTIYTGINVQATVYTSGLSQDPTNITITKRNEVKQLSFIVSNTNKFIATFPSNLTTGIWNISVTANTGCVGVLENSLLLTNNLSIPVNNIDPAFSWTNESTSVTITARDPLPMEVGFKSTPLVYLSPPSSGALAISVRAVEFVDSKTLTGVIPKGTKIGTYDVIVINSDGTVGLLIGKLQITNLEPPKVFAVEPGTVADNAPTPVTVKGKNFINVTLVEFFCKKDTTVFNGNTTISSFTESTINIIFPLGGTVFSLCIIQVTVGNGNKFKYSAISIRGSSGNLKPWSTGSPMIESRKSFGLVAGRPTLSSRYIYAIGGDNSTISMAKNTIESVFVDISGNMQTWTPQRYQLPVKITQFSTISISKYIYIIGGIIVDENGNQTVSDKIYRSQILNPITTPVADISIDLLASGASNLTEGLWYYKISAVFPSNYQQNPSGESLPGELVVVNVPKISGIKIILSWDPIPFATAYRVYRTSSANKLSSELKFLAETNVTTYSDIGNPNDFGVSPLPLGSLGKWFLMTQRLNTSRESHSSIAIPSRNGTNEFHIYIMGGRDKNGVYLNNYEYLNVSVTPDTLTTDEIQVSSLLKNGLYTFPARAELSTVFISNNDFGPVEKGSYWLYIGPGRNNGGFDLSFRAQQIGSNGELVADWFIVNNNAQGSIAGYCLQ